MSLSASRKRLLDDAISNSTRTYRSKSNNLLLNLGGKSYASLQGSSGGLTPAGNYYYAQSNQAPPGEFDGGTLQQRGATEFLLTAGKARVLRRLKNGQYNYSALGKRYFREHKTTYLVNVPGLIKSKEPGAVAASAPSHTPRSWAESH